jgi:hypothetical protein
MHTPEPWFVGHTIDETAGPHDARWYIFDGPQVLRSEDGRPPMTIAVTSRIPDGKGSEELNARRLVACVNVLAGLNPEHVSDLLEGIQATARELWDLDDEHRMAFQRMLPELYNALAFTAAIHATMTVRHAPDGSEGAELERGPYCHKLIPGTRNLCTRGQDHRGPCRCKAADVDAREGDLLKFRRGRGSVNLGDQLHKRAR